MVKYQIKTKIIEECLLKTKKKTINWRSRKLFLSKILQYANKQRSISLPETINPQN
jgi:hypothetical protein